MKRRHLCLSITRARLATAAVLVPSLIAIAGCCWELTPADAGPGPGQADPCLPIDNGHPPATPNEPNVPATPNEPPVGGRPPDNDGSRGSGLWCVGCHSSAMAEGPVVVDASGAGGHSLSGDVLTDADCGVCHEISRHQRGAVRLWADPSTRSSVIVLDDSPSTVPAEGEKLGPFCLACHDGTRYKMHAVAGNRTLACTACHELHDPGNANLSLVSDVVRNETLGADRLVVFTARTGVGSFSDGEGANDGICEVCHTATTYHRHDGSGTAHNEGSDCTTCHAHALGFLPAGGTSCIGCHSSPRGDRPAVVNADGSGGHHLGVGPLTDADCVTCHEMSQHQQGQVRVWGDPTDPTTPLAVTGDPNELVAFCGSCHSGDDHPIVHTTGASWEPACTACHDLHDPANSNLSLVSDGVWNETLSADKPVVFTARSGAGSFSDGQGANDGICEVCHTATTYHRHDGSGTAHNEASDCTTCHAHALGFLPAGGSCLDCHQTAQGGRRAIAGEFGLASHHLQGTPPDETDCVVCHEMSQHQQGQVRLKNADDPGNPAAVVELNGDPAADSTEAVKLEAFCLACHDGDAAGGAPPFTDGITPRAVDPTLWANASHKLGGVVGPMTCFGDGETFGCHSSGHGSKKRKLLAPYEVAPTPPADAEEEEGFCFTCHDADGPASTDVQSQFALASHHNVSSADQGDGSRVECTNCHNPHTANATTLLADPNSGQVWNGSQEGFCLVCHDGTPPPDVTFPPNAGGSGYDKSAFPGTTHQIQLGGDSCTQCHEAHGSAHQSTLKDQYVVADYNRYSAGDSDYAACWACHDENLIIEQDNAFKNLHKKHVKNAKAPCIICHEVHAPYDNGEQGLVNFEFSTQHGYDIQYIDGYDASTSFWFDAGQNKGYCYIKCHNKPHKPKDYRPGDPD